MGLPAACNSRIRFQTVRVGALLGRLILVARAESSGYGSFFTPHRRLHAEAKSGSRGGSSARPWGRHGTARASAVGADPSRCWTTGSRGNPSVNGEQCSGGMSGAGAEQQTRRQAPLLMAQGWPALLE
ncbi:unnamed protein product [Urochloa humidicola]